MSLSKSFLRKKFINIRNDFAVNVLNKLSPVQLESFYQEYFKNIHTIIRKSSCSSQVIAGFYPIKNEPDCLFLLKEFRKIGYCTSLPFVAKKQENMEFYEFHEKSDLIKDIYGTPAPDPRKSSKMSPNIFLVPLLAFSNSLFRLGYGGGYYDRYFLEKTKRKGTILYKRIFNF